MIYKATVVTPKGPCEVTKEIFREIIARKKTEAYFGGQILFAQELTLDDATSYKVTFGSLPAIKTMAEFEEKFITQVRSILTE